MSVDLMMTDDGELVLNAKGDLAIVYGDEEIAQEVLFRLKTTGGDWLLSPSIGASLEDFIGQPNTEIVHAAIEERVKRALSFDDLLYFPNVSAIPVTENEVFILVEFNSIESNNRVIQVQSGLDLRKGLVFARIDARQLQ